MAIEFPSRESFDECAVFDERREGNGAAGSSPLVSGAGLPLDLNYGMSAG